MRLRIKLGTYLILGLLVILVTGGCNGSAGSGTGIAFTNDQLDPVMNQARNLKSVHFEGKMQVGDQVSANYNGTILFDRKNQFMYTMELQSGTTATPPNNPNPDNKQAANVPANNPHGNMTLMMYMNGDNYYVKDPFNKNWRSSLSDKNIANMLDELKLQTKVSEPIYLIKGVKDSVAGLGKEIEEKNIDGKQVIIYEFPADLNKVLSSNPYELDLGNVDPTTIKEIKYHMGIGKEDKKLYMYSMEQQIETHDKGLVKVINTMNFSQHDAAKIELPPDLQKQIDGEKNK